MAAFVEQGARVAFVGVAQAGSGAPAQQLEGAGHGRPWWRVCDVRDIAALRKAIGRIAERIYGVCQMTGKPIPRVRLNAKPWAKYTIEAARQLERGWGA